MSALHAKIIAAIPGDDGLTVERMARLFEPGRRAAAILSADLDLSAFPSRYVELRFDLIRTLETAIDQVVVDRTGIVGRHAGEWLTAFFIVGDVGSPSTTARLAVEAARRAVVLASSAVAEALQKVHMHEHQATRAVARVGLHWSEALYIGQVVTPGRVEVAALGTEVDQCARIQSATGPGQILASKELVDQLGDVDAARLRLEPATLRYRTVDSSEGLASLMVADIPVR